METSPIISPLTAVELVHKGTDEHSVQEPAVGLRGKKVSGLTYLRSNQNGMLSRVLKHLQKLFHIVPSLGPIFPLLSKMRGGGKTEIS